MVEGGRTFVELEEFKGASGTPALFFGEAVVCVALVFGGFAHCGLGVVLAGRVGGVV